MSGIILETSNSIYSKPENYIIHGNIGSGQFSTVFRGKSVCDDQPVAIKKVLIVGMDPKSRQDCIQEINLLQKLNHPNIIKYIGSFLYESQLNIVLELADAGDLARMIRVFRKHRKLIPERSVWKYFVQVVSGLDHMHSKRIMHRDIKPANIFVTAQGVVKLGDLGLSRFFSANTMTAHTKVGTPYYMSPERLLEDGYTFPSDIWSLGCLLYEMGALQTPFHGSGLNLYSLTKKIERGEYPPLPANIYTQQMKNLIAKCLRPDPAERPDITYVYSISKTMAIQMSSNKLPISMSQDYQKRHHSLS